MINRKNTIATLFAMLVSATAFADLMTDSLLRALVNSSRDTGKVYIYNLLAQKYSSVDADTAIILAGEGIDLATELGYTYGQSELQNTTGVLYFMKGDYNKALEFFLQSLRLKELLGQQAVIARQLGNIGVIYKRIGELEKALEYYLNSVESLKQLGDETALAKAYNNIGEVYRLKKDDERAMEYYDKSLALKRVSGDEYGISVSLNNIGILYANQGKYAQALDNFREARMRAEAGKAAIAHEEKVRRTNLQYSGIFILLFLLGAALMMMGKFQIPARVAEGLVFFTFLLIFEFCLVLLDPYIEIYSGGAPAFKLLFNAILAALILPAHHFFEHKILTRR